MIVKNSPAEVVEPEASTILINAYSSSAMTVDKYEGDAIIDFWNAQLDVADHAVRAVRAALRCQSRLSELPTFQGARS